MPSMCTIGQGGLLSPFLPVTPTSSHITPWSIPVLCRMPAIGKSSLLRAVLSQMVVQKGSVEVGGSIGYVPQVCTGLEPVFPH